LVIEPRRLRAPEQNGAVLAEPPFANVGDLLVQNRKLLSDSTTGLLGRSWRSLRAEARRTAVETAHQYMLASGEPVPSYGCDSIIAAGHQPELFHAGVWVKNFALNGVAKRYGVTPLNLVVDNDTAKSCALRVPTLGGADRDEPQVANVPYDQWGGEVPFEERAVRDESLFAALPERSAPLFRDWKFTSLLAAYWQRVVGQTACTPLLGERLAAARRSLEQSWGCSNLEVPVSLLCTTAPFAWFAGHLLTNLAQFHAIYNDCVQAYRHKHGIRSRSHPVPNLIAQGDWYEIPFWTWRTGEQVRHRPMARVQADGIELKSGHEDWPRLPRPGHATPDALVKVWLELQTRGFKIRSRALTNTLFVRLFFADLFVHGIGGAKYDELTDEIVRRFYRIEPPGYMVISATLHLPFTSFAVTPDDCRRFATQLRDLHYNPERHLPPQLSDRPGVQKLLEQRDSWVRQQPDNAAARKERFVAIRAVTGELAGYLRPLAEQTANELARCRSQLEANNVFERRDYAFCLFPESILRPFCTRFLALDPHD
jgi:hypothetical protein